MVEPCCYFTGMCRYLLQCFRTIQVLASGDKPNFQPVEMFHVIFFSGLFYREAINGGLRISVSWFENGTRKSLLVGAVRKMLCFETETRVLNITGSVFC